jgi:hypothetical protein
MNWKNRIYREAAEKGIDLSLIEVLIDEWEQEYSDEPEDLEDLIFELNSPLNY